MKPAPLPHPPQANKTNPIQANGSMMKFNQVEKTASPQNLVMPIQVPSQHCDLRLFVTHLDASIDEEALLTYFGTYGDIIDIYLREDDFAFITFLRFYNDSPMKSVGNHVINGR